MIKIDLNHAKEITKNRIRIERDAELVKLDTEVMKNILINENLIEIEKQKQILRDITCKIDEINSLEELSKVTLTSLLGGE